MTLTTSFKHTQLLETFNQAVCRRMAEEHAFIKTLDEIFQAQGQEIVRYEEEVQRLRRLLSAANTKIAELTSAVAIIDEQQSPQESPSPLSIEQSNTNEVSIEYKPKVEMAILEPNKQWLADHTANSAQSTSDEEISTVIVPNITIKEETIEDDSDTNPFPESDMQNDDQDDNEMAGSSSGNSNQSNDGDEMTVKCEQKASNKATSTFECPFCQKTYSLWSAMKRRVVLDNGQKVFTCRYCKEAHNLMKSSHAYKKSPNHKRPYKCSVCS